MTRRSLSPDLGLLLVIASVVAIGTVVQRPDLRSQAMAGIRTAALRLVDRTAVEDVSAPAGEVKTQLEVFDDSEVPSSRPAVRGTGRVPVRPPQSCVRSVVHDVVWPIGVPVGYCAVSVGGEVGCP